MISLKEISEVVNKKLAEWERAVENEEMPLKDDSFGDYIAPHIRLMIRTNKGG